MKNVKIAANSKGIDNAYIIESIEFVEYIIEPVTGFDFNEIQDTDTITNAYNNAYDMIGFEVKENWEDLEIRFTPFVFGNEVVFSYSK
mgnify:CR=1 FL=1